ncbi:hypothetical protein [Ilumatobacter sp.]|uniref:hypothetical protein n=1 Tax=Ilumatobacter sp. TaxID=1967498 RepID=UPI003AF6C0E4
MSLFTRRRMLTTVGGAAALSPVAMRAGSASAAATQSGLITLRTPIRAFDSRTDTTLLGGDKIEAEESVIITVGIPDEKRFLLSVFLNLTITETEGAGFLTAFESDLSGKQPMPETSNVNWSQDGQTLANMALSAVGGENGVEVFCGGLGRTHFIVDIQGYVPFEDLSQPT